MWWTGGWTLWLRGTLNQACWRMTCSCFRQRLSMVTETTDSFTITCHGSTCQDNWSTTLECKLPPALWWLFPEMVFLKDCLSAPSLIIMGGCLNHTQTCVMSEDEAWNFLQQASRVVLTHRRVSVVYTFLRGAILRSRASFSCRYSALTTG